MSRNSSQEVGLGPSFEKIMRRISELEEHILSVAPSDSWAIGEKSFTHSPSTGPKIVTPSAKL